MASRAGSTVSQPIMMKSADGRKSAVQSPRACVTLATKATSAFCASTSPATVAPNRWRKSHGRISLRSSTSVDWPCCIRTQPLEDKRAISLS